MQIPTLTAPLGYCPQAADTSIQVDLLEFYLLRQRSPQQRLTMAAKLMCSARQFSLFALQQQFAQLDPAQFARKVALAWLQEDCPPHFLPGGSQVSWIQDSTQLASELHQLFTDLQIPYLITGGVAAIAYGEPRTTRDLDMVIAIPLEAVPTLVTALEQAGFYVPGVEDILAGQSTTLQITQIATISRADLMLANDSMAYQQEFRRRQLHFLPDGTQVYLASPEDLILAKLQWAEHSQSEKQWRDISAIFKVQQERLDYAYLYQEANRLSLTATLERLMQAAGVSNWANPHRE